MFIKYFELKKNLTYTLLGLKHQPFNQSSIVDYINFIVKKQKIADFQWQDGELGQDWEITPFSLKNSEGFLLSGATIRS